MTNHYRIANTRAADLINASREVYDKTVNPPFDVSRIDVPIITKIAEPCRAGYSRVPIFKIPTAENDFLTHSKALFFLASRETSMDVVDSLALFVNIVLLSFPNFESDLIAALNRDSIDTYKLNEADTGLWVLEWKEGLYDCEEFNNIELSGQCHRTLCGIYWNFLTKKLTALNLEQWYKIRRAAYARSSLADEEDPALADLRPDLGFVSRVNSA